jgi:hypothetical protein
MMKKEKKGGKSKSKGLVKGLVKEKSTSIIQTTSRLGHGASIV